MLLNLKTWLAITALAGLFAAPSMTADSASQKDLGDLLVQNTPATHYIWTDKVVYTAGENQAVRWTAGPNSDPYPYTAFVYRENVVTGERVYLPGMTSQVTDAFGNTAAAGFAVGTVPEITKMAIFTGAVPAEPGSYQFVAEIRDYTATRVVKDAHAKFAVVTAMVDVPGGDISTDTTWTSNNAYRLTGTTYIRSGATLTIEPGTYVLASGNTAVLVVNQGGKINAIGTKARPIVMTCNAPIGTRFRGCWGGLVLLGRAPINRQGGIDFAEGLPNDERGQFGGNDPLDSSGALKYVRVEFAGIRFSPENELNGIAFHGVGSGTQVDYIQVHQGQDDGVEFFGGTVNAKHIVVSNAADDSIDWVLGWNGKVQYAFVIQKGDDADRGIEGDNLSGGRNNEPRSNPTLFNVTLIGDPSVGSASSQGMILREGTAGSLNNFIVTGFGGAGVRIDHPETFAQATAGNLKLNGMVLWGNSSGDNTPTAQFHDQATADFAAAQPNIRVVNPLLRNPFDLNDPDPTLLDGSPAGTVGAAAIPPDDGFFDQHAQYNGAFAPNGENWMDGWTYFLQEEDIAP